MVKSSLIEMENWDEITRLCSDAILKTEGVELIHFVIKMGSQIGIRNPMFVRGVGKAILGYLDMDEVERL